MADIRTPDQRLRVFISSTIEELREERRAVREAVESLRLIPVFFEAGARPHPPRELYRAYLDQSDIFVGIYAGSYGWVAPEMTVSGLEDEYLLSGGRPQLIYIKDVPERDARLTRLLDSIRGSGAVSYQKFSTPAQLTEQLRNDLALLLSERFAAKRTVVTGVALPAMRSATIGRDAERAALRELLLRPDVGMVTLTGTGGTGKSHLALRVAHDVQPLMADGARFVALAPVARPEQVVPAIAAALGLVDSGADLLERIRTELAGRQLLLLMDNFEHVLDAAPVVGDLLDHAPRLKVLVTSRAPLHLVGEQVFTLAPLAEPPEQERDIARLMACPSVELFIHRARARAAQLPLDTANLQAVAALCRRLDGLPLAIELAAAHTKYLTPVALEQRMHRTLDLLERGPRDLPERQRTMRAAIGSSHELLVPGHRTFFRRLAVLSERWTIELAAAVTDAAALGLDAMDALEQLVDMGLVRVAPSGAHDADTGPRFQLLHVVREFALEELDAHGERDQAMERLQAWCMELVKESYVHASTDNVIPWMDRVEEGYADLRTVIRAAMDRGDVPTVWTLVAHLNTFWLLRGYRGEALDWLRSTGLDALAKDPTAFAEMPAILRGGVLFAAGTMCYYAEHLDVGVAYLERAVECYAEPGIPPNLVFFAWLFLGMSRIGANDPLAGETMAHTLRVGRANGDGFLVGLGLCFNHEMRMRAGQTELAAADLEEAERLARTHPRRLLHSSLHLAKGNLAMLMGNYAEAGREYALCLDSANSQRIAGTVGWALNGGGYCALLQGRVEEARTLFREGIEAARLGGYRAAMMAHWAGLAWALLLQGDAERAGRLFGAAEAQRSSIRYSPWRVTQSLFERVRAELEKAMAPDVLARSMAEGAALSMDEVLALASS